MLSTAGLAKSCGTAETPSPRLCAAAGCLVAGASYTWEPTMGRYMHSASRLSTERGALLIAGIALLTGCAWAQLPDGPGKAETQKLCSNCHELERSISLHQDREGWQATINKMMAL